MAGAEVLVGPWVLAPNVNIMPGVEVGWPELPTVEMLGVDSGAAAVVFTDPKVKIPPCDDVVALGMLKLGTVGTAVDGKAGRLLGSLLATGVLPNIKVEANPPDVFILLLVADGADVAAGDVLGNFSVLPGPKTKGDTDDLDTAITLILSDCGVPDEDTPKLKREGTFVFGDAEKVKPADVGLLDVSGVLAGANAPKLTCPLEVVVVAGKAGILNKGLVSLTGVAGVTES